MVTYSTVPVTTAYSFLGLHDDSIPGSDQYSLEHFHNARTVSDFEGCEHPSEKVLLYIQERGIVM